MSFQVHPDQPPIASPTPKELSSRADIVLSGYPLPSEVRSALYPTRLSNTQIRVTRLFRAAFQDAIECSIGVVSAGDGVDYEAL